MIRALRIRNFALIESLSIEFNSGFTVITGETGSGKSILLNALNLILGERANYAVIGPSSDKASVEADIDISDFSMQTFFEENELDYHDLTIVRREISSQGRSRAFINDTPVQLNVLKDFSVQLVQIHSQYNTLELKDRQFQLKVLDTLAGVLDDRKNYAAAFVQFRKKKEELTALREELDQLSAMEDYNTFQLEELQLLKLDSTSYDDLTRELKRMERSDEVRSAFTELQQLFMEDTGILALLNRAKLVVSKQKDLDPELQSMYERVNALYIEASDLGGEFEKIAEGSEPDPERQAQLLEAVDAYNRVLQKHRVQQQEELLNLLDRLSSSSQDLEALRQRIAEAEAALHQMEEKVSALAKSLHKARISAVSKVEKELQESLNALKLENTRLEFRITELDAPTASGISALEIFFAPNLGIPMVPVHEAASGGELSRVMLALQSLMCTRTRLKSILFDEIDTGVSGDVAQKMGAMLKSMGTSMQVIAITHLPQVAAKGGQHLLVTKNQSSARTSTSVRELNTDERIEETARLMSGDTISASALETAKALMK